MKKRMIMYAVLCIILILFSSCRRRHSGIEYIEDPSWSKVQIKSTLVIGIADFVPILSFRNEKNEIVGYDIDIFTELCRRLGIRPVFYPIDWTQKEILLNTGVIDCIASGFSITEDRKKRYGMCTPYLQNVQIVVTLAKNHYRTLAQLRGKTLAVQAGSSGGEALLNVEALKGFITVQEIKTVDQMYKALDAGACDAIVVDLIYSYDKVNKNSQYSIIDEYIATEYYTFAFRKADTSLVAKVESVLIEMNNDDTIPNFSKKWFRSNLSILNVGL